MASLDSLPPDQRAVLQLVLQRGRSYDEIAKMLSIDRAAVRQRALGALEALGPLTDVPAQQRALITDYLLGQLPSMVSQSTRASIARSPAERAWARVVASELAPLASNPLPEIPVDAGPQRSPPERAPGEPATPAETPRRSRHERAASPSSATAPEPATAASATSPPRPGPARPSSRRGGALLLGGAAALIIAAIVVVILLVSGGGGHKQSSSTTAASTKSTTAGSTTAGSSTTTPNVIGQVNLIAPDKSSKTAGIAEVVKAGSTVGIVLRAQNVPANSKHDAYAVWLYNSPSDARILGFVNPGVGSNGQLSTAGALPSNASHYKQLVVTLETKSNPKQPGKIILQGQLAGV
jgi:hypothetical protein